VPRTPSSSSWRRKTRETLAQLKTDGVGGDDVVLQVATGSGWEEALDAADLQDGDLPAIGTRLWAGSRACSWVPAAQRSCGTAPVPVLVLALPG